MPNESADLKLLGNFHKLIDISRPIQPAAAT